MKIEIVANPARQDELSFNDVKEFLGSCIGVPIQPHYIEKGINGMFSVEYECEDVLYLDESGANILQDGARLEVPASLGLNN